MDWEFCEIWWGLKKKHEKVDNSLSVYLHFNSSNNTRGFNFTFQGHDNFFHAATESNGIWNYVHEKVVVSE